MGNLNNELDATQGDSSVIRMNNTNNSFNTNPTNNMNKTANSFSNRKDLIGQAA